MSFLNIKDLKFKVKKKNILENINFHLNKGEILSIIGPSGAGKSSILKILAGLSQPTHGNITLSNKIISSQNILLPTGDRNIGLMFQEEVLFPHLSVYKNIAFGIEHLKTSNKENLIKKYLTKFGLLNLEKSFPEELSSGEKQRVSLARILITKPKVLLLDEPLSALDPALRMDMRIELKQMQRDLGITFIHVTHSQDEALALSSIAVVMNEGTIEQADTPIKLFNEPINTFVADFVGGHNIVNLGGQNFCIRTDKILISEAETPLENSPTSYKVLDIEFLGHGVNVILSDINNRKVRAMLSDKLFFETNLQIGQKVKCEWHKDCYVA